jgi:hypothetical protein
MFFAGGFPQNIEAFLFGWDWFPRNIEAVFCWVWGGFLWVWIMGSQNAMGLGHGSNISVVMIFLQVMKTVDALNSQTSESLLW